MLLKVEVDCAVPAVSLGAVKPIIISWLCCTAAAMPCCCSVLLLLSFVGRCCDDSSCGRYQCRCHCYHKCCLLPLLLLYYTDPNWLSLFEVGLRCSWHVRLVPAALGHPTAHVSLGHGRVLQDTGKNNVLYTHSQHSLSIVGCPALSTIS